MKETIRQILREGLIKEMEQKPKPIRVKMDMPIPSDIKKIKDILIGKVILFFIHHYWQKK